jgi:hypothetical protein
MPPASSVMPVTSTPLRMWLRTVRFSTATPGAVTTIPLDRRSSPSMTTSSRPAPRSTTSGVSTHTDSR